MALTPEQRVMRARIAANTRWAHEDPAVQSARMVRGLQERFEREVDPDGLLAPAERARRADAAKRAHYARLGLASSKARKQRQSA